MTTDIPGLVAHHEEESLSHWHVGELYETKCDSCGSRWPCSYFAWVGSQNIGADAEQIKSHCNVDGCKGTVLWTEKEWKRNE